MTLLFDQYLCIHQFLRKYHHLRLWYGPKSISNWRPPPSWISENNTILDTLLPLSHPYLSAHQQIGQAGRDKLICVFYKMATAAILDLLFSYFGLPTMFPLVVLWFLLMAYWSVWIRRKCGYHFAIFSWKCLFSPGFGGFWGFWPHKIMTSSF